MAISVYRRSDGSGQRVPRDSASSPDEADELTNKDDSIEYIGKLIDKYYYNTEKILLFAPNAEIVEMIYQKHIPYCLVFHSKDCVEEIRNRMQKRGNQKNFIDSMLDPIDRFYEVSITDTRPAFKIELHQGEYLSDKISFLCKEKEKQ